MREKSGREGLQDKLAGVDFVEDLTYVQGALVIVVGPYCGCWSKSCGGVADEETRASASRVVGR